MTDKYFEKVLEKEYKGCSAKELSPLVLAYIGDAVDRSRGVACAEYKKAPAERQLQQGAQTNNHLHDNRKRKKRQG